MRPYTISREWLDPTEFLLSSLFILFLLFWVILIDFELDCPILRAFIERERRAGGRPFQCRVHSRLCDVHLLHHLRSGYIEEGSANEYTPFFFSCAFFYSLSLFFLLYYCSYYFYFSHADQNWQWTDGCWTLLCMAAQHRGPFDVRIFSTAEYNKIEATPQFLVDILRKLLSIGWNN